MALRDELRAAVREAGEIIMDYYGRARVAVKDDNTVVTEADHAVDAFLEERVRGILPGAAYVGEEKVSDAAAIARAREGEWTWVVDPIDGTACFADGIETFCCCLGLMRNAQPYAGAVLFPALDHLYEAVAGEGAWYDGRPACVMGPDRERDRTVLYVDIDAHTDYRFDWRGKTRCMGSAALHYLLVARGVAAGAVTTCKIWDYAAAAAVVQEAGGTMKHVDGRPVDWRAAMDGRRIIPSVVAAPAETWDALAAQIHYLGPNFYADELAQRRAADKAR